MEPDLDELYAVPLGRFTEARNDLSARLKAEGHDQEARKVKGLRKPTLSVWVTNQLSRRHPEELSSFVETARGLEQSQEQLMAGTATSDMRNETARRNEAVARLVERASTILAESGSGAGSAHIDKIRNTLIAASTDAEARHLLESGRVTEDLSPSGFESAFALGVPPAQEEEDAGDARRETAEREARRLSGQADAAEQKAARLVAKADDAEQAAAIARSQATEAVARAKELRAKSDRV